MISHRKMVDTKSSKLAQNRKVFKIKIVMTLELLMIDT